MTVNSEDPQNTDVAKTSPIQRRAWMVGAAVAAGLAGAGLAWWRYQPKPVDAQAAQSDVWVLELPRPDGSRLALAALRGKPLLVNFWATWCPPCVDELPMLNAFYKENRANGMQVVGIAVDKLASVQTFLQRMPIDFPVVMADFQGLDLSKRLGNDAGGLPFTVFFGADGTLIDRKIGRLSQQDLQGWRGR
jgi:thiol-disulfide isomerase/thioredoxin